MSEIRRLPLLRGSLTERFVLRQERGRTPSIVRLTTFSHLVGLPDVYRAFILIAHADRQTTSQGSELRPYNWDISVEGERWQSRSCWRYSRRKKWQGLSSNSHWWSLRCPAFAFTAGSFLNHENLANKRPEALRSPPLSHCPRRGCARSRWHAGWCSQPEPEGGALAGEGRHGSIIPNPGRVRSRNDMRV
jgi:hypothetical protein